jgi:polyhydroxyalkanoate synthesis regulator protein
MGKQNVAMMERAMKMFTPFAGESGERKGEGEAGKGGEEPQRGELDELKQKIDALQRQLNDLGKGGKG